MTKEEGKNAKDALDLVISSLTISDVYLHNSNARIAEGFDPKINSEQLSVQFRHAPLSLDEIELDEEGNKTNILRYLLDTAIRFIPAGLDKDVLNNEKAIQEHIRAEIRAYFAVEYVVNADELDREAKKAFGESNAFYHVWPYWREYVHNMCMRMRLPEIVMPMFRLPKKSK